MEDERKYGMSIESNKRKRVMESIFQAEAMKRKSEKRERKRRSHQYSGVVRININ